MTPEEQIAMLREALITIESQANVGFGPCCAVCHGLKRMDHQDNCPVKAALAATEPPSAAAEGIA